MLALISLIQCNLTLNLVDVLRIFPYYTQLDSIWCGIPSFDSKLVSSQPNVNHTSNFLDLLNGRSAKDGGLDEGDNVEEDRATDEGGPIVTNVSGELTAANVSRGPATANVSRGPAAANISRGPTAAAISRGPATANIVGGATTNSMGRPAATSAAAMRGSIAANSVEGHAAGDGEERRLAVHNVAAGPAGGSPASQMRDDIYDSGMQGFDNEHQMDMKEAEMEGQ